MPLEFSELFKKSSLEFGDAWNAGNNNKTLEEGAWEGKVKSGRKYKYGRMVLQHKTEHTKEQHGKSNSLNLSNLWEAFWSEMNFSLRKTFKNSQS